MIVTAELSKYNVNGLKGSIRLKGLMLIYFTTFFQWLEDKSYSLEKTMNGLDKNLETDKYELQNTKQLNLYYSDLLDSSSLNMLINKIQPDEIYNFADQDNVSWSKDIPLYSYSTTTLAVIQIYEF